MNIYKWIDSCDASVIMAVACGKNFTLVATENGDMYSFGSNSSCQLGVDLHGNLNSNAHLMSRGSCFTGEEVVMVAASTLQSAAVTKEGSLFTWGSGQGLGRSARLGVPGRLGKEHFGNSHVVMVDCGLHNIIVLTASGRVWTCGHTDRQEPLQIDTNVFQPIDQERFNCRKIIMVASGVRHKMAIDQDGMLWTWGENIYGEMCCNMEDEQGLHGTRYPIAISPAKFGGNKVVHVDGGTVYTMVVTEDGTLWGCGYGHTGALGIPFPDEIRVPQRIGGSEMFGGHGVRMTSCGTCHTLILGTDNRMWACGHGYSGVLGLDDFTESSDLPVLVPNTPGFTNGAVMTVSVSESHSTAVMLDGSMYIWGRGLTTAPMLVRPTGQADGWALWTPHQLNPNLFHGACIGRWHTWLNTHPDHAVAFAMGIHSRLGADTPMANTPPELVHRLLGESMHFKPEYSAGLLALLGLHHRRV